MKAILAMDKNKGIGFIYDLPWPKNLEDLQFFKDMTIGTSIVMGHNTYKSFGSKPLPNRQHFVITKEPKKLNGSNQHSNVIFLNYPTFMDLDIECMVIGGSSIYKLFEKDITDYYITIFEEEYECDSFFENDLSNFDQSLFTELTTGTVYHFKRN